ncbi:MAG: DNA primase [Spirochaetes bacterium]|nr:DNA primase [Spirochaetota bacterium]
MKIAKHVIDEIARKVDIVDVVGDYVSLKKRGARYWGLSPFTSEKTPSFSVEPEKQLYYCFSSGKGGSAFQFIMEMEGLSFPEAVRALGERAGVKVEAGESDEESRTRDALKELNTRVAGSFRHIFVNSAGAEQARRYMSGRKISEEVLDRYDVGYAPADRRWLFDFLRKKQYSPQFLAQTGLFSRQYPEVALFSDRVMFPIHARGGQVVGFGGRRLGDYGPKYINSPESVIFRKRDELYGLYQGMKSIRERGEVYLCEGYMDVLALAQAGVTNAVAPLGTSFTEGQARLVRRYAGVVTLLFDADSAGLDAARRAAEILEKAGIEGRVCQLPAEQDPGDIVENEGAEQLQKRLTYTKTLFDYLVERAVSRTNIDTPRGKEFVLREVFPYIKSIGSAVRQEASLHLVADALGVDRGAVERDFQAGRKPASVDVDRSAEQSISFDLYLMLATVAHRNLFSFVRTVLSVDDFQDDRAREVFVALEECFRASEQSTELLLERIETEDLRQLIVERVSSDEFALNGESIIRDTSYRIKQRNLQERRKRIGARLRRGETANDAEELDLLHEQQYLDTELRKLRVLIDDRAAK